MSAGVIDTMALHISFLEHVAEAAFQDVEYRGSRGVSHQVQEPLCARDRQAV